MCSDLKDALDFTSGRVDELEKQKKSLKDKMAELERKHMLMETLEDVSKNETARLQIEKDLDDLQQYTRKYNLEFAGLPKYQHLTDEKIVLLIAETLDIELESKDIVHRININNLELKPIIVLFGSYKAKQKLYKARKSLKGVDWSAVFGEPLLVYINESLTARRRKLYKKVRSFTKAQRYHGTWTLDGKIFLKTTKDSTPVLIRNLDDLKEL